QVPGLLGARACDRHLRSTETAGEVAAGRPADAHARLQRRELHEASTVQRELRDLSRGHDTTDGGAAEIDECRFSRYGHRLGDRAKAEREIDRDVEADLHDEVFRFNRLESAQLRVYPIASGRK